MDGQTRFKAVLCARDTTRKRRQTRTSTYIQSRLNSSGGGLASSEKQACDSLKIRALKYFDEVHQTTQVQIKRVSVRPTDSTNTAGKSEHS